MRIILILSRDALLLEEYLEGKFDNLSEIPRYHLGRLSYASLVELILSDNLFEKNELTILKEISAFTKNQENRFVFRGEEGNARFEYLKRLFEGRSERKSFIFTQEMDFGKPGEPEWQAERDEKDFRKSQFFKLILDYSSQVVDLEEYSDEPNLKRRIKARSKKRYSLNLDPEAITLLYKNSNGSYKRIDKELERLSLYFGEGATLTTKDIETISKPAVEPYLDRYVKAVIKGDPKAVAMACALNELDFPLERVIWSLNREFCIELGLPIRQTMRSGSRWSREALFSAVRTLSEFDLHLKSSGIPHKDLLLTYTNKFLQMR